MISYSKILFFLALAFIAGVALASWFFIPYWLFIELFLLGVIYVLIFFRCKVVVVFAFCLMLLSLGMWRLQIASFSSAGTTSAEKTLSAENFISLNSSKLIRQALSSPQAELLKGILFGGKQDLDYQ